MPNDDDQNKSLWYGRNHPPKEIKQIISDLVASSEHLAKSPMQMQAKYIRGQRAAYNLHTRTAIGPRDWNVSIETLINPTNMFKAEWKTIAVAKDAAMAIQVADSLVAGGIKPHHLRIIDETQ